jgi:phage baseplate assembly protein V
MAIVNGVAIGIVTNVQDPSKQARIKVTMPWLSGDNETDWIRIAAGMAGDDRGSLLLPEVGDEVLLAFDHGDTRFPYVLGFLWNGQDKPPSDDVRDRKIKSKNGHQIRFLDSTPQNGDMGALVIEDAHGNTITMSNGKITISSVSVLELNGNTILLTGPGFSRTIAPNSNPI